MKQDRINEMIKILFNITIPPLALSSMLKAQKFKLLILNSELPTIVIPPFITMNGEL